MKKIFTLISLMLLSLGTFAQEKLDIEGLPITFDDWGKSFTIQKTDFKAGDKLIFVGGEVAVEGWEWGAQVHPKVNVEGWPSLCDALSMKDGKAMLEITADYADKINSNGGLPIQGYACRIDEVQYVAAKDYDVKTIWEGNVTLSWEEGGRVALPASAFEGVPAGSLLTLYYSQVDNQWDQAQFCYPADNWSHSPNFNEGDYQFNKTLVPTDLYGWSFASRETPLVLTQTILDEIQQYKGDYNEDGTGYSAPATGIIIHGSGLTFTKATISVEKTGGNTPAPVETTPQIVYWEDGLTGANKITMADGTTLQITSIASKSLGSAKKITVDDAEYTTIKLSNGAQNTLTLPDGKLAYTVTFYSYVNKSAADAADRDNYWKEVNGENYDAASGLMKDFSDVTDYQKTPDVSKTFDLGGVSSFTFTNTGYQPCVVIKLGVAEATAIQTVSTTTISLTDAIYNLAGQKVDASYKGVVIKNGKKVLQK